MLRTLCWSWGVPFESNCFNYFVLPLDVHRSLGGVEVFQGRMMGVSDSPSSSRPATAWQGLPERYDTRFPLWPPRSRRGSREVRGWGRLRGVGGVKVVSRGPEGFSSGSSHRELPPPRNQAAVFKVQPGTKYSHFSVCSVASGPTTTPH